MNQPTLCLASLLLLGSATIATAQDERGGGGWSGPAQGVERGAPGGKPGDGGGGMMPRNDRGGGGDAMGGASEGTSDGAGPDMPRGAQKENRADDGDAGGSDKAGKAPRKADAPDKPAGAKREKSADDGKGGDSKARADRKDKSTEKAAQDKSKGNAKEGASQAKTDDAGGKADDKTDTQQRAAEPKATKPDSNKAADSDQARGDRKPPDEAKKADLSGDRGERVRSAFHDRHDAKRRVDVDIDISIGRRLPHDWDFVPVPVTVVEVVPEYEGYVYAYVDDEYVICDPVTYEVVAVLPAPGGAEHAGGGSGGGVALCSATLTLTDDERADILRSIQLTDEAEVANVTVGFDVPSDIDLLTFPAPVVSRTGKLAACRYFVVDDQIAIVDPKADKVVMLVDEQ
ncbi:DUF1236 domain-containing protein [Hyphomicrobium sp.]|uniref:DUF1236 domain-containing protein n=1 Tax=Hyphomicrobium sp. TaxID=82 RepID=UPI003F72B01F